MHARIAGGGGLDQPGQVCAAAEQVVDRLDRVLFGSDQCGEAGVEQLGVQDAQMPQAKGRPIAL